MTVEPPDSSFRSAKHLPHRILVADDDMAMLRLNAEVLMSAGYDVDAVEDGAAACRHLAQLTKPSRGCNTAGRNV